MASSSSTNNNPRDEAARLLQWVSANFASSWFLLALLLATYAPRRLFLTYFNLFLRRHARRLLNVIDPYISVDILECPAALSVVYSSLQQPLAEADTTYEEVKAYLSGGAACSRDARELRAEGARLEMLWRRHQRGDAPGDTSSACVMARTSPMLALILTQQDTEDGN